MKQQKPAPEERARKEEARRARERERLQKHIVVCPHCGGDALDHMTQCPQCGGELQPAGYKPMKDGTRKKIRIITYSIGAAVAAAIVIAWLFF